MAGGKEARSAGRKKPAAKTLSPRRPAEADAPAASSAAEASAAAAPEAASRAPVPSPSATSTWDEELWRLRRLYGGAVGSSAPAEAAEGEVSDSHDGEAAANDAAGSRSSAAAAEGFAEEQLEDGGHVLRFTHQCSDPDWDAESWAPEGLRLEVRVPASYPEPDAALPELRLLAPRDLPQRFAEMVPRLFAEAVAQAPPRSPAVYRSLQHVDRYLTPLWLKLRALADAEAARLEREALRQEMEEQRAAEEAAQAAAAEKARAAAERRARAPKWTSEEQARLEDALVNFQDEPEAKKRWALIAKHVGAGRSSQDCADRFRACRDFALGKAANPDEDPAEAADGGDGAPAEGAAVSEAHWSAEDVRRTGVEVRLIGLSLEGFATMLLKELRLSVVCGRCHKPTNMATGERGIQGTKPCTAEGPCPVCKQPLLLRVAPSICHSGCPTIAHVLGSNCYPVELLRSDFEASCGECTEVARVRNVGPGYRCRSDCHSCFAKLNLTIEGADLLGSAVQRWREVASEESAKLTARRQLQLARTMEKQMGIRVGTPLPDKGTCKHLHKSYRWLRFPCCGRAFPCPTCHDEQMDHPYEWANRMLCGLCSFEQPFTKDQCSNCGAAQTRSKSAYWEGGEGNRNHATMSRNDPHKYRGLGKTTSSKKAQAGSK